MNFSLCHIRFLCNRVPSHVLHDCVINTSNVQCPGCKSKEILSVVHMLKTSEFNLYKCWAFNK